MTKQKGNQQKKWLFILAKYRYIALNISSILLFSVVGTAVNLTCAFSEDYPLKIAQPSATNQDANRALREGLELYRQGTADSLRQAIKKWEEALSLYRAAGDRKGEVTALFGIGHFYNDFGEKQKALEYYNQALPLYRAIPDRHGEATTLNTIGSVYNDLGEPQKALSYYNQALPLFRAIPDRKVEATILNNIGLVYSDLLEDKQKALSYYNQALPLFRAVPDRKGEATVLMNIGKACSDLGDQHKALSYYKQALLLHRAVSNSLLTVKPHSINSKSNLRAFPTFT
ncbi:tetratricopeptide repeat protein [Nostoc sp. CHAB 5784]|uniref:tetratricopeptide repeat protein n=1 Tax=Nostoc mirabile TaxID=2907820 RepID=UPI001E429877|nr:tetratricopeptide repeat protein [Nostoc mirabile]MCC5667365.1 tetratricopeptide repeat protein [Nostoc mirabile CHAB5784]